MSSPYKFTFNEDVREFAEKHLGETDEIRERTICEIRNWLSENQHLNAKTDDKSILAFLRGCKFDTNKTKEKLTNYYKMRAEIPEWFSNRDPLLPEIQQLVRLGVFVPLKKYQDNRLVVIIRTAAHDPKVHSQDDVFKAGKMILDVAALEHECVTIYGVTAIFDMNGISFGHVGQLPPSKIKKAVHAWQNYHCSPKHLEFVNAPFYINVVLRIFKNFMSDKLKSRVKVHFKGIGSLHEVVEKENLPAEYGGTDGSLCDLIEYWSNKLLFYREWFQEDEKFKANIL